MEEENNSEEIIQFQYSNVLYFVQQVEDPLSVCLKKVHVSYKSYL